MNQKRTEIKFENEQKKERKENVKPARVHLRILVIYDKLYLA